MRKILSVVSAAALLALTSCEEKGPVIDFGSGPVAVDTTYVGTAPTAQQRIVVAEEFTGGKCANCPKARDLLTGIADNTPGRVLPIEIHVFNFIQSNPATEEGAIYDLRTQDGTDIGKQFYVNVNQMPSAGINRVGTDNERLLLSGKWASKINEQLAITPAMNVDVESAYADGKATVKVKVAYTQAVSKQQFMTLAILEDGIIDVQEYPDSFDHHYTFNHTLRDLVTPVTGQPFLADVATKEAGRVYQRTFVFDVPAAWKPENCKVIAFVHNNDADSKEILQAAETKLKP
jgi:hypothetical protein